jgi:hypothetical protein
MGFQNDFRIIEDRTLLPMSMCQRLGIVLSLWAMAGCAGSGASNNEIVNQQTTPKPLLPIVETIELALTMPKGAHPLSSYVRYYAQHTLGESLYIVATFVKRESAGKIEIVDFQQIPQLFDGGCDVIKLRYSVSQKKVVSLLCNGDA